MGVLLPRDVRIQVFLCSHVDAADVAREVGGPVLHGHGVDRERGLLRGAGVANLDVQRWLSEQGANAKPSGFDQFPSLVLR